MHAWQGAVTLLSAGTSKVTALRYLHRLGWSDQAVTMPSADDSVASLKQGGRAELRSDGWVAAT